jgi:hypothetical protein
MGNTYEEAEKDYLKHKQQANLKLLPGGKSGPPYADWLSELPVNTVFLVDYQETCGSRTMFLPKWQIVNKTKLAVELWDTEKDQRVWIIPFNFCQDFRLFEILHQEGTPNQEDLAEKEVDD